MQCSFCVCDVVEMRGEIGETFVATINGRLAQISINVETKCAIIMKVIPGPEPCTKYSYLIKFMNFQFPIEVDEDYILKCVDKIECCK